METPARTPEDIIGIIPHTLGYIPRDSLVAVIIGTEVNGSQSSSTTLRVDFTLETAADILLKGGSGYVDLIGRACAVTGVFLVVYDEGYQPITPLTALEEDPTIAEAVADKADPNLGEGADPNLGGGTDPNRGRGTGSNLAEAAGGIVSDLAGAAAADGTDFEDAADLEDAAVHRGLVRAAIDELAQSFASAGIDTLCAWWVSHDRFGRIDEDGDDSTPLLAATTSPCATELIAAGSNPVGTPQELVIAPMTAEAFARSRRGHTDEWMGVDEAFVILADVVVRLDAIRSDDEPIDVTHLHAMLDLPTVMALDALLVEKWSRDALEMILSFDHPDFPPSLVARLDGEQLCDRSRRFSARPESAQEIVGLSARAPRPRDVMLTIAFFKEYLPMCHPRVRADTYAVIAWFEWALGGSTMAESYASAATDIDPEHGLAKLVVRAVRLGFLPRWLMESEPSSF